MRHSSSAGCILAFFLTAAQINGLEPAKTMLNDNELILAFSTACGLPRLSQPNGLPSILEDTSFQTRCRIRPANSIE